MTVSESYNDALMEAARLQERLSELTLERDRLRAAMVQWDERQAEIFRLRAVLAETDENVEAVATGIHLGTCIGGLTDDLWEPWEKQPEGYRDFLRKQARVVLAGLRARGDSERCKYCRGPTRPHADLVGMVCCDQCQRSWEGARRGG